jgi:hypothetical protein
MKTIEIDKKHDSHVRMHRERLTMIQELMEYGESEVFAYPNYVRVWELVEDLLYLNETDSARKVMTDIYASILAKRPTLTDWFVQKLKGITIEFAFDHSKFDKFHMAVSNLYFGHKIEYAVMQLNEIHEEVVEVHYTPKSSDFKFESLIKYYDMLELVSEYKDVALLDTCQFGIPEHKEIPVKYDVANMSLMEVCEAYLNLGGKVIIVEP